MLSIWNYVSCFVVVVFANISPLEFPYTILNGLILQIDIDMET